MPNKKTINEHENDIKLLERCFNMDDFYEAYKSYINANYKLKKKGISTKSKIELETIVKESAEKHRIYQIYNNIKNKIKQKQRKIANSTPPLPPQPSQHQQPLLSHQPVSSQQQDKTKITEEESIIDSSTVSPQRDDDSSTVFDVDTIVPDDVPSSVPDEVPSSIISSSSSPQSFTSELLRRIK